MTDPIHRTTRSAAPRASTSHSPKNAQSPESLPMPIVSAPSPGSARIASAVALAAVLGLLLALAPGLATPAAAAGPELVLGPAPGPDALTVDDSPRFGAGVHGALVADGAARVTIHLTLPSLDDPAWAGHPALDTDVHPMIFDLVGLSLDGGTLGDDAGDGRVTFTGRFPAAALARLADLRAVEAIELAPARPGDDLEVLTAASSTCPTSNTRIACVQGGRFGIEVVWSGQQLFRYGINFPNTESASFYPLYGSLEVLAKVLDGCGVNNRYWVFSAGATSLSYSVEVTDYQTGNVKLYPTAGCPLTDTTAFTC